MSDIKTLRAMYSDGSFKGWAGEELARKEWDLIKHSPTFKPLVCAKPKSARKLMLYDVVRKLLGRDTENYAQEIGDCVSFGAKNAIEYLEACERLIKGDWELWRKIFPPYLYGTGRIYVGGGQLGNEDGSLGSWMAEAVTKYGVLAADEKDVPQYSGSVAKAWGGRSGKSYLDKFKTIGSAHPVKSAAQLKSWDDMVTAICNGYPCTIASDQGFEMEAGGDGFHDARGNWYHQMSVIGVDDTYKYPYAVVLNSWGDAHGRIKDFDTGETMPIGVLRVHKQVMQNIISQGDSFAFSNFEGFPDQEEVLTREMFKLVKRD